MFIVYFSLPSLSNEQEAALWASANALIDGDTVRDRAGLTALIETAQVVVRKDDELLGLWRTDAGLEGVLEHFTWVSLMLNCDECCIGDENGVEEFDAMQIAEEEELRAA